MLGDDSVVYKLLGPVLVKQDKEEAVSTVKNRADYMESELKRYHNFMQNVHVKYILKLWKVIDRNRQKNGKGKVQTDQTWLKSPKTKMHGLI